MAYLVKKWLRLWRRQDFTLKGSHIVLRRDYPFAQVVVPDHKSIDTGTLDNILDGANLSIDDFIKLMK